MNCKPGDLAYVVKPGPRYGLVVRVLRRSSWWGLTRLDGVVIEGLVWETDTTLKPPGGGPPHNYMLDQHLRPIRDPGEDAQDETLQWLPVPSQHKEVA